MKKKFSVIIPAHNEEDVIAKCIISVLNQTYKNFEIIVVNDGSTDKTGSIVKSLMKKNKNIRIISFDKGHSAAFSRNRGAELANGEILIFLDADGHINNIFLEELNKAHKPGIDGFLNNILPRRTTLFNRLLEYSRPESKPEPEGKIISNLSKEKYLVFNLTKKSFLKIKGYNENIFYFEDEDLTNKFYSNNFKAIVLRKAKSYYELPSTLSAFIRQCKWIGKGINSIPDIKRRNKSKFYWLLKSVFILSPLILVFNLPLFLVWLLIVLSITYIMLLIRNKKPIISILALPLTIIKTLLVTTHIYLSK